MEEIADQNLLAKIHFDIIINGNKKDKNGNMIKIKRNARPIGGRDYKKVKSRFKSDLYDFSKSALKRSFSNSKVSTLHGRLDDIMEFTKSGNLSFVFILSLDIF